MPACSREVLTGSLRCPRGWVFPGQSNAAHNTTDKVILAKEKTGVQLKQDATKMENKKFKGCKALLQRGPRSGRLWKTPRHHQNWQVSGVEERPGGDQES